MPIDKALQEHRLILPILQLVWEPNCAMNSLHQRYGDLALTSFFGKKILFVRKPEHIEQVFSLEAKGLISRDAMRAAKQPIFGSSLINSTGEIWTKQRKLMQPAFTREASATWMPLIVQETDAMVNKIRQNPAREINISLELKLLVQSVFTQILFGKAQGLAADTQFVADMTEIMKGLVPEMAAELLGFAPLRWIFSGQIKRMNTAFARVNAYIDQKIANPAEEHSLLALLLNMEDKATHYRMSAGLLKDEMITLFFAGQDTTVNALIWLFYLLGRHPAVQRKISDELLARGNNPFSMENLAQLTYTKAAVNEALRLYPPATTVTRQTRLEVEIGGKIIPKNTNILVSICATHRNPTLWKQPDRFDPEHFLDESQLPRHRYAFMPFGGGRHLCLGRHLAEMEILLITASLCRAFTFKSLNTVGNAMSVVYKPDRDVTMSIKLNRRN